MNIPKSKCIHIHIVGDYTKEDIIDKQDSQCDTCLREGPHLWVCLHRDCLYVGCNDSGNNHCVKHFQKNKHHSLYLNLTSLRVYCLLCEYEVFLENNDPPLPGMFPTRQPINNNSDSDSGDEYENEENVKPRGLTGLQNLGNTCYMNSAVQALSNCPQLTNFFLECEPFIRTEKKPGLSHSYMILMKEMWHRKRPSYVVPSGIAYGIKVVYPVFRGYTQQDVQEFLRCFMDQLHEELKEPLTEIDVTCLSIDNYSKLKNAHIDSGIPVSDDSSQSDGEYETCDSGLSIEKLSYVDEGLDSQDVTIESTELQANYSQSPAEQMKEMNGCDQQTNACSYISVKTKTESCDTLSGKGSIKTDEANDVFRYESPYEEKQSTTQIRHSSRDNGHSDQVLEVKQMNSRAVINSIFKRKKKVQYRSVISDTFDGKILSSVQCLTCDTVSTTEETFQDLSLPIPNRDHLHLIHASQGSHQKSNGTCTDVYSHQGWFHSIFGWVFSWFWGPSVSLQDCLAAFFSADELKGDNMYSCEKCRKLRNGVKYSKVIQLPEVLCIHLKRFRHEVMFSSKIGSHVSFPLEDLDLSAFIHKSYPCEVATYDLASVICHHGTAGSGHYTSFCYNYLKEQWYEFDDQYVTAVDAEMVRNCEAYVLFYRKSGEEMIKKRQCAVQLMERCQIEHELLRFHISKQWVNKFNNFAEPGPITNTDFLCEHGGVPPQKTSYAEDLCTILPQAVWEYLHDTFGGGPPCTHLYKCTICQEEQDTLNQKRKIELEEFIMMNANFKNAQNLSVIYALSINWFKAWEKFVCKEGELPGPIDNGSISYMKNNVAVLKLGSDYCTVSQELYLYLYNIYGGGPDVKLQPNVKVTSLSCHQFSTLSNEGHAKSNITIPRDTQSVQVHASSRVNSSSHNHPPKKSFSGQEFHNPMSEDVDESSNSEENICAMMKHTKL